MLNAGTDYCRLAATVLPVGRRWCSMNRMRRLKTAMLAFATGEILTRRYMVGASTTAGPSAAAGLFPKALQGRLRVAITSSAALKDGARIAGARRRKASKQQLGQLRRCGGRLQLARQNRRRANIASCIRQKVNPNLTQAKKGQSLAMVSDGF